MKIPASYHQERLWFIDAFEVGNLYPSSPVYHNVPILLSITGPLNHQVLEQSIREVIHRHEALRTHIITVDNKPMQSINTSVEFHLMVSEITDNTPNNEQTEPVALAIEESQRPFLMDKEPFIRARLFQISNSRKNDKTNKKSLLLITLHHMIADHYSLGILIREMLAFYSSHLEGGEPRLSQLSIQYADFSQWQRQMPAAALKSLLRYWKGQLKGELQPLEIPTDRARAAVHIFHAARQTFTLVEPTAGAVRTFAQQQGVSKEVLLLAVFKILLHRYSGQEEVVVGISAQNRDQPGTETIIGPIANLLVIRTQISGKSQFHTLLSKVNRTVREALKYQSMPFDRLVMEINPHKDMSRTALFDVLFQYEENPFEWPEVKDLRIERVETNLGWGKYDLNLMIQNKEEEKSFSGIMVYNSDYYDDATIERLICHYKTLLENILKEPHQSIDIVSLLSEEEQYQLVSQWNQTEADFPTEKTIHQVFEEQVEKGGDRIAVIGMEYGAWSMGSLTYFELDEKSNQIAHLLRKKGVRADTIVAVILGRSPWMISVLLGILKAGGAYLPIEPEYPEERIRYILADSAAKILLTGPDYIPEGTGGLAPLYLSLEVLHRAIEKSHLASYPLKQPATSSENLAYIIYTSGTTGRPKGCTISHKNVLRLLTNNRQPVVFNDDDVWVMAHSYCFDFSVWEMYGALLCGGRLVIPLRQRVRDTAVFLAFIKQYNVTVLNQTPAAFYNLVAEEQKSETKMLDRHLRMVIFGGDKLEPAYLKSWAEMYPLSRVRLINMYGITETTIHVTHYTLMDEDITAPAALSPIGIPLPETTVYIFNGHLQLQPASVTGELYVGGSGVSRGYLNNPKLTHGRFLENPYKTGEILYRTGDLGRWLPNGSIQYVGRIDHQVQLRGFRIEMGEIESQLLRHQYIKEAVITDRGNGGDKYLCAYIVPYTSSPPTAAELRRYLSNTLPDYMIPSFFVVIAKIPLTPNGKVDRKSLPEPDVVSTDGEYTAPRDAVEKQLAEIWSEVLNIRRDAPNGSREIGIDANFFELGGHSLKAISLASKIHKEFNSKISIEELFAAPTIRELAGRIRDAVEDKFIVIDPVEKKEYYPLSPSQNRLYILHRMDEINTSYNVPLILTVEGTLDKERLEDVFNGLIQRHESLRTSFEMIDDEPIQKIYDDVEFAIEGPAAPPYNWNNTDFIRPFVLSQAPLLRVGWRKIEEKKHILMVDMHHIITDGTSQNILMEEFESLSIGKELPPLRLKYKDYSQWQRSQAVKEAFKQQEGYWLHELEGEIPVLNMPTDYPRPPVQSFEGKTIAFEIGAKETTKLNEMASSQEATLFMVLLGIYNIFLFKISGQEDIIVGTPIAGREHADLEQIIGMLVNTLALRNYPSGNMTFKEFLRKLRQRTLRAYENQDYQFEQLVEKGPVERDLSRNPLFDVMFILQNIFETPKKIANVSEKEIGDLKISLYPYENKTSKFDLTMTAMEKGEKLHFYLEYCTKLFEQETIRRFIGYFKKIISSVIKTPGKKISEIEIITGEEKRKVLYEFNDTAAEYPRDKTIHELFEEQVRRTPDGIALRLTHRAYRAYMTYNQLNKKSNQLAHHLREKGVGPDCLVGIIMERSVEIIVAILGTMKAGGAYLPMDPDYPAERIKYMLEDSAASIVLTFGNLKELIGSGCEILEIGNNDLYRENNYHLEQINKPIDLAYVIYTSGSTGKPKGVMIEHRSLANFIKGMTDTFEFTGTDCILSLTTISFDIFGLETILPLTKGSKVVMGSKEEQLNPVASALALDEEDVTILQVTPARLALLLSNERSAKGLKHLKYLLVGGEVFPGQLLGKTREVVEGRIFNLYGPTETTIWSTVKEVSKGETLNIGKPTANTRVYIMNGSRILQPVGVSGELWISGAGLARGYINKGGLTNRKFIINPYETGEHMYHTGDIARWLPDGNIEFLGRKDNQVKIRGFRIELEEIETHLEKYKEIREAVVLDREDKNGERHLCAYVVTGNVNEYTVSELREYLSQHLPNYMIPSYFVKLDKIPLTPNGKTDRKALPEPSASVESTMYIAPRNENEEKLVELWATVLGIKKEKIGVNDNFFDRGGSSLTIIRLAGKMEETFKREIPVTILFRYPTIRTLSEYLDRGGVPGEVFSDTEKLELIQDSIQETLNIFGDD